MWLGTVILILIIGSGDSGDSEMLVRQARFDTYEECIRTTSAVGPEIFDRDDLDAKVDMEKDTVHVLGFCLPSLKAEKQIEGKVKKEPPSGVEDNDRHQRFHI